MMELLSEEYLIKMGFDSISENSDGSMNYWNKEKDCSVDVETHILTNKIEISFKYRVCEKRTKTLIYTNQLENLYFALTDKKLNNGN